MLRHPRGSARWKRGADGKPERKINTWNVVFITYEREILFHIRIRWRCRFHRTKPPVSHVTAKKSIKAICNITKYELHSYSACPFSPSSRMKKFATCKLSNISFCGDSPLSSQFTNFQHFYVCTEFRKKRIYQDNNCANVIRDKQEICMNISSAYCLPQY